MDIFCAPLSWDIHPLNKCFGDFFISSADSLLFFLLISSETLLTQKKSSHNTSFSTMLTLIIIILLLFVLITLVLFYIPLDEVSIAQVFSLSSQIFLWIIVLNSFYNFAEPHKFAKSSLKTIKLFVITRFFFPCYYIYLSFESFPNNSSWKITETIEIVNNVVILVFAFLNVLAKPYLALNARLIENELEISRYEKSSFFEKVTLTWPYSLLKLGSTRTLESTDIEEVRENESCAYQQSRLDKYMPAIYSSSSSFSLMNVFYKRFFHEILGISLLGFLSSALEFTTPVFIALIENYLASDQPLWRGIALVVYLLIIKFIMCIVTNQHNFLTNLLSVHIKAGLSSEIYQKLLRISLSSISQNKNDSLSYGKIINLIQVDLDGIASGIVNSMKIVILPFTLCVGLYLNFKTVGFAGGMTGTVIIIIIMIFTLLIGRKLSGVQKILMEKRDKRMKACNELFNNIRIYKIYNWEVKLSDCIKQAREEELEQQRLFFMWNSVSIFLSWGAQNYIAAGILTAMTLSGVTLTPANVFAGLSVIRVIKNTMEMLPTIVNSFIQTKVSLIRIQDYLRSKDQNFYIEKYAKKSIISMKNASFSWDSKENDPKEPGELTKKKSILKNLTLDIYQGELIAVVGKFGSGKSSFLQSLIQNMVYIKNEDSQINLFGSVAFCNQEAWIQNKTLRDNILFGKEFNEKKYWDIIRICMLQADLDIFPGGDMTEIGERGINLSGGQKARVNIARAVYSDADIFLFDDPLAALDQYVGKRLFEDCIYKHLNGKTRIIVTNNQQYLSYADRILVMNSGKIEQFGSFSSLISQPGYFIDEFMIELKQAQMSESTVNNNLIEGNENKGREKKIIENEDRVIGSVKFPVYKNYFINAGGVFAISLGILAMVAWQVDRTFTDFYLADWTNQTSSEQDIKRLENIIIYCTGSFFISIFIYLRVINTFYSSLRAARIMFANMLAALLNAPIPLFYDVNPMGRILNRLSKDQSLVDSDVANGFNWVMASSFSLFMIICFCIYTVPLVLISLPIAIYISYKVQQFYLRTSRELIRLESISKSPIIQHFSETLNGISTIRAFGYQKRFIEKYFELVDINNSFVFYKCGCYYWLAVCIEIVSDLILLVSTLAIVYARDYIDPGLSGVCLIYVLMLPEDIYFLTAAITVIENYMVSVERVHNMALIKSENQRSCFIDQDLQSSNWPSQGVIEFYKYSARYRPDTDIILNNVSFIIKSHEKVGIMGRTGSGKSSIVNALFRVIESSSGKIFIDGVDTAEIGLDLLRQKLCVIPQDPALFQGTLRENIDLLKQFTDEEILNTLKLVQLDFGDKALEMDIKENASNLSVGQKQLICIARALLRKSKIIILDEATASIDFKTDVIIQQVIKERFEDCTVLTIAHRINTIMKSDRILVLDKGQVVEFDTPQKLQENNSHFCKLANSH